MVDKVVETIFPGNYGTGPLHNKGVLNFWSSCLSFQTVGIKVCAPAHTF